MANQKTQTITIRIPIEDYGWIIRYSEKNDTTTSQVIRKAIKMFMIATSNRKKKAQEVSENG